jgi:hypothetical protein
VNFGDGEIDRLIAAYPEPVTLKPSRSASVAIGQLHLARLAVLPVIRGTSFIFEVLGKLNSFRKLRPISGEPKPRLSIDRS